MVSLKSQCPDKKSFCQQNKDQLRTINYAKYMGMLVFSLAKPFVWARIFSP
jgi:hypothetical protein